MIESKEIIYYNQSSLDLLPINMFTEEYTTAWFNADNDEVENPSEEQASGDYETVQQHLQKYVGFIQLGFALTLSRYLSI